MSIVLFFKSRVPRKILRRRPHKRNISPRSYRTFFPFHNLIYLQHTVEPETAHSYVTTN